ncbi:hypothetical protein O6H91_03G037600 [Diphasiastrum complanatum]|uniref:Uncharacterized protein n=1 Tax=Diphasiastrum complanatum TaxID=34168 RepID=A0ACC2E5F9_DIPCM|nr:hypothetical protein O6H91_03G037600 [Diphasiastrum complanatum]
MATPHKPWKAEYAKSSRATCRSCSNSIAKDAFRIARVVPATQFDGLLTEWHHAGCIMKKAKKFHSLEDVEGVDNLRWEDQQKLRKYVEGQFQTIPEVKIAHGAAVATGAVGVGDCAIENAKSSRATCKGCNEKIEKGTVRISTMVESDSSRFRGKVPAWRHAECFLETGLFVQPMEDLWGWENLEIKDQEMVLALAKPFLKETGINVPDNEAPSTAGSSKLSNSNTTKKGRKRQRKEDDNPKRGSTDGDKDTCIDASQKGTIVSQGKKKKMKNDGDVTSSRMPQGVQDDLEKQLELQSRALWKLKDDLREHVTTAELKEMLAANDQDPCGSEYDLRERCADGMLFGALKKCPMCEGPMEYQGGQYRCRGFLSAWSKCNYTTRTPERHTDKWKIPEETSSVYLLQWFKKQGKKKAPRLLSPETKVEVNAPNSSNLKENLGKKIGNGTFSGFCIAVAGRLSKSQAEWKALIEAEGGRLLSTINAETTCVITNEVEIEKNKSRLQQALGLKLPILREAFLIDCLEKDMKVGFDEYTIETGLKSSAVMKVKVKGRSSVHEDSGLQDVGHVLEEGKTIYNTTLNLSDLSTGINSYYILQVIEEDQRKVFRLFRKWGRVGNSKIGGQKLDLHSKTAAICEFKRLFREKTGNSWEAWESRTDFEKQPGKFYPLEIDYGVEENPQKAIIPSGSKNKLDPRLLTLMKMLFDVETYRLAMLEFEINVSEMPLGKLSKRHIERGFQVLTELQNIMNLTEPSTGRKEGLLVDASNRFFTLIPTVHPHVIRDMDDLKAKIQMLEALRDIEIASQLLNSGEEDMDEDPIDLNYKKLNCAMSPLSHDSLEFDLVRKYLERTHAPTHKDWALELEDVFSVRRYGENDSFATFKASLRNRMLLWHGSRLTNYVGILSQGLRVAPPEAPATGYMFGKGVYFADLVSKSAQYCYTSKANPVGLMLLSEVALGEMKELKSAKYMEKPPEGFNSTKGLGQTKPNESTFEYLDNDVTVPCGLPVPSGVQGSELLYNEYIVYDPAQVRLRFLLKVRFKHKW